MYEAFISFKNLDAKGKQTPDSMTAYQLYNALSAAGVTTFFSNAEIQRKADPRYASVIDTALRESKVIIVVGTRLEYVESRWVEYEWRYFSTQINNGVNKHIVSVMDGFRLSELPPAFAQVQNYTRQNITGAIDMVCGILGKARPGNSQPGYAQPVSQPVRQSVKVGDRVQFGRYPQSGNTPEPITWRVLDIINGKALMISEYLLDSHNYDEKSNVWQSSELRSWLNNDFLNKAFNANEQQRMGNINGDKVTCLSIDEVNKYFSSNQQKVKPGLFLTYDTMPDRMAKPTENTRIKFGTYIDSQFRTGWWWLRSPGVSSNEAACVNFIGIITNSYCHISDSFNYCVRPVVLASL